MSGGGEHREFMALALREAEKCVPTPTAFCVGCVLVYRSEVQESATVSTILSTGYSRELPGNTHAEANALNKATALTASELRQLCGPTIGEDSTIIDILPFVDVYTTMEPCSVRTSGLAPCADALIAAKVRCCYIGVSEPLDFVQCEGAQKMKDAGIGIVWISELENECLQVARKGR